MFRREIVGSLNHPLRGLTCSVAILDKIGDALGDGCILGITTTSIHNRKSARTEKDNKTAGPRPENN